MLSLPATRRHGEESNMFFLELPGCGVKGRTLPIYTQIYSTRIPGSKRFKGGNVLRATLCQAISRLGTSVPSIGRRE